MKTYFLELLVETDDDTIFDEKIITKFVRVDNVNSLQRKLPVKFPNLIEIRNIQLIQDDYYESLLELARQFCQIYKNENPDKIIAEFLKFVQEKF